MMEEDFDYEYIISCYGYSTRSIYDLRNGKYFLQFRGYYEQSSNSQIFKLEIRNKSSYANIISHTCTFG